MQTLKTSALVLVLLGGTLLGCGSSGSKSDASGGGGSGGGGDSGQRLSQGEFCSAIGNVFCDRGVSCGLITAAERPTCVTQFQAGCCAEEGTCDQRLTSDAEEMAAQTIITGCTGALPTYDCAMLLAGNLPVQCGGAAANAMARTLLLLQSR